MRRHFQSMTPLLWVIAFALLIVRTADAHVHLCFDGQEPPSSVYMFNDTPDYDGADSTRQDQDIDALGPVLVKKMAHADTLSPIPVTGVVLILVPQQRDSQRELSTQNPSPKLADLFLPLLRGPPA